MAAGRGELLKSFMEGLERRAAQQRPDRGHPGPGGGHPGPGGGQTGRGGGQTARRCTDMRSEATPDMTHMSELSLAAPRTARHTAGFPKLRPNQFMENLIERLPSEILMKILSHLDASSLICMSHVNKCFSQLANDDVLWQEIYTSEIWRSYKWAPKPERAAPEEAEFKVERHAAGYWKKVYLRAVSRQEVDQWRKELRDVSPYTGLPSQAEWVLRKLGVSWELTVCDVWGEEVRQEQSRVFFFESSLIACWSGGSWPTFRNFSSMELHGERSRRKRSTGSFTRLGWRSLLMKTKVMTRCCLGEDQLVKLFYLRPAFIVAMWRGNGCVAFILLALHFHSLLGSPLCPYSAPVARPPVDRADPQYGLRGYTLHFVLHNTHTQSLSGHFTSLCCSADQIRGGLLELRAISTSNLSEHRCVMGKISMPWSSEGLDGRVENCCFMSLTLLDEFHKPFWCVSSPVRVVAARWPVSQDYGGEHFLLDYCDCEGQVKLKLVWLKEQDCFLLVGLSVFLAVWKVNERFGTNY